MLVNAELPSVCELFDRVTLQDAAIVRRKVLKDAPIEHEEAHH